MRAGEKVSAEEVLDLTARLLEERGGRDPEPHQMAPEGRWRFWELLGGRGSGKSWAGARWLNDHVQGPACLSGSIPHRMAIVAPTLGDAVEACFKEPAGIKVHEPRARLVQTHGGTYVRWPDGSEAKLFGAHSKEDSERLRAGGNRCAVWLEELAAMRYARLAWDQMEFGLRIGPDPRGVVTTTPKPIPIVKALLADERISITRATTHDNPHLEPERKAELLARYEGTRLGRQEIYAEILDDVEGALWSRDTIEALRVLQVPQLWKVCIGVDPSAWLGEEAAAEREDEVELGRGVETGIVAAGLGGCPKNPCDHKGSALHVYRIRDVSGRLEPHQWGERAVDLYHEIRESGIANQVEVTPETNQGGGMVLNTIRSVDRGDAVLFTMTNGKPGVRASDSKRARAEPVAALEQQNRAHSFGDLAVLEDVLCSWLPTENWSPDRLDAYVWAVHGLNPWRAYKAKTAKATGKQLPKATPGGRSTSVAGRATVVRPGRR